MNLLSDVQYNTRMEQRDAQIEELRKHLQALVINLRVKEKKQEVARLQEESQASGFWSDDARAQSVMRRMAELNLEVTTVEEIEKLLTDAQAALELGMGQELSEQMGTIQRKFAELEQKTYLSGPYDRHDAILSIHSGQGGTEAMDWAEMLQRMYQRYLDRKRWKWELTDLQSGDEAGIKSVTLMVHAPHAYGYLRGERGTHRLVRQSPFNADHLRQTSFALVEVMPVLDDDANIVIKPDELRFEATRSSGHGGQNVNKVNTAVRLTHFPTGIVVECQSQRYQEQNRKIAMQLLRAKLWELQEKKRQEHRRALKGGQTMASWGTQIRSYVLHPYKLVKDVRTGVESHAPDAVLDGDLDAFVEAELKTNSSIP